MTFNSHPLIVMYDFDGVIINSDGANFAAYCLMKDPDFKWNKEVLKKTHPIDLIRRFEMSDSHEGSIKTGIKMYQNFEDLLPARLKRIKFMIKMGLSVRKMEHLKSDFILGVTETMKTLHEAGIIQGICTNSEGQRLPKWLKKKECEDYISEFTSRNDRQEYGIKPGPRAILNLVNKLKKKHRLGPIDRNRVYFCGDNPSDIWAGQNARVKTIAVLSGHSRYEELSHMGADHVLDSINQIIEIPAIKKYIE